MDIAAFAELTKQIIAGDGFEDYIPTLLLPARQLVMALEGIPADVDTEQAALKWAEKTAKPGEDYLLAYKINAKQFRIVHRQGKSRTQADFDAGVAKAKPKTSTKRKTTAKRKPASKRKPTTNGKTTTKPTTKHSAAAKRKITAKRKTTTKRK
jgi:hypothetical protein